MTIRQIHTSTGHRAAIYALAPGADARHIRSAGGDGWIVEWNVDDPENGRLAASVETQIFCLCSLPERELIVAGNMNGGVHWIDRAAPERTRNVQHHGKGVYALLAAGEYLFSAGGDGILTRWSLETGRAIESYQLSNQGLRTIAWSPERRELAVGASDNSIYFLDSESFVLRKILAAAHDNSVFALAYSPDNRYLLSGGRDAMLKIWDLENDAVLKLEKPAHWFTINHIVYAPDKRFFATASRDKTFKIWDAATFELLKVVDTIRDGGHINSVNRLLWLPDCLISCSDDRTIKFWDVSA